MTWVTENIYQMDHCEICNTKLQLYKFNQYYIKDHNQQVIGIAVRCLKERCNNNLSISFSLINANKLKDKR